MEDNTNTNTDKVITQEKVIDEAKEGAESDSKLFSNGNMERRGDSGNDKNSIECRDATSKNPSLGLAWPGSQYSYIVSPTRVQLDNTELSTNFALYTQIRSFELRYQFGSTQRSRETMRRRILSEWNSLSSLQRIAYFQSRLSRAIPFPQYSYPFGLRTGVGDKANDESRSSGDRIDNETAVDTGHSSSSQSQSTLPIPNIITDQKALNDPQPSPLVISTRSDMSTRPRNKVTKETPTITDDTIDNVVYPFNEPSVDDTGDTNSTSQKSSVNEDKRYYESANVSESDHGGSGKFVAEVASRNLRKSCKKFFNTFINSLNFGNFDKMLELIQGCADSHCLFRVHIPSMQGTMKELQFNGCDNIIGFYRSLLESIPDMISELGTSKLIRESSTIKVVRSRTKFHGTIVRGNALKKFLSNEFTNYSDLIDLSILKEMKQQMIDDEAAAKATEKNIIVTLNHSVKLFINTNVNIIQVYDVTITLTNIVYSKASDNQESSPESHG